jgi:hypothetical protein
VLLDDGSPESDRYSVSADASCLIRLLKDPLAVDPVVPVTTVQ